MSRGDRDIDKIHFVFSNPPESVIQRCAVPDVDTLFVLVPAVCRIIIRSGLIAKSVIAPKRLKTSLSHWMPCGAIVIGDKGDDFFEKLNLG